MKPLVALAVVVATYMVAFTVLAVVRGNQEFVFYIATMLVTIAVLGAVHLRVRFSMGVLWGLAGWGLAHLCGGLIPVGDSVLYNFWLIPGALRYDHAVHAYGFGVATWACWEGLGSVVRRGGMVLRPSAGLAFGLVCMGMGLGALNEVIEFAATKLVPDTNVGGYENTAWDLVSNLVGASVAAGLIVFCDRRRGRDARGGPGG